MIVEDDPSLGRFQGEKMTRLMQRAVNEFDADWVLLLDADELIRCPHERLPLPEPAESNVCLKVAFRTYQAKASDDQSVNNPAERIQHRLKAEPHEENGTPKERRFLLKVIVPRTLAATPGACVVQGNHHLLIANNEPPHEVWTGFDYAHFSLRSVGRYASKIAIGTLQHIYRSSPRANMESYYLTHLEELRTDFEGFSRRFYERLPSYLELSSSFTPVIIHDPLPYSGGPLRYTSSASDYTRLFSNLIGYAEVLAKAAAEHAVSTRVETNQIKEVARLELLGADSSCIATHNLFCDSSLRQTVRFSLGSSSGSSRWNLRIGSPAAVIEITTVRWICEASNEVTELTGQHLHKAAVLVKNTLSLHHAQYLTFFKAEEHAVIGLKTPSALAGSAFTAVELQIQIETDATRTGVRLMHNNSLGHAIASSERVQQIERKLAERTTLPGAVGFQIYRLWRAINRLFKRKTA